MSGWRGALGTTIEAFVGNSYKGAAYAMIGLCSHLYATNFGISPHGANDHRSRHASFICIHEYLACAASSPAGRNVRGRP